MYLFQRRQLSVRLCSALSCIGFNDYNFTSCTGEIRVTASTNTQGGVGSGSQGGVRSGSHGGVGHREEWATGTSEEWVAGRSEEWVTGRSGPQRGVGHREE